MSHAQEQLFQPGKTDIVRHRCITKIALSWFIGTSATAVLDRHIVACSAALTWQAGQESGHKFEQLTHIH